MAGPLSETPLASFYATWANLNLADCLAEKLDRLAENHRKSDAAERLREVADELADPRCNVLLRHGGHIRRHYVNAMRKHQKFAYGMINPADKVFAYDRLDEKRSELRARTDAETVYATDVLDCEVAELYDAMANGTDLDVAEEAYDCIAVLLRIIDCAEHGAPFARKTSLSDDKEETTKQKEQQ